MGRKKNITEEVKYESSKYQKDIYEFVTHSSNNLVISASAGSGKTYTLIQSLKLIPEDKRVLFCAFNKDIVKELQKKIGKMPNVDVRTVHSLGCAILSKQMSYKDGLPINENKYRQEVYINLSKYTHNSLKTLSKKVFFQYLDNIVKLTNFIRYNLSTSEKEAFLLSQRHELELIDDEIDVAYQLLEWGKNNTSEVDFTDMVWLPLALNLPMYGFQYDFVFGDECQDFSCAQRELLLRCRKINTRYIFAGDENQAIYSFASASPESFRTLKSLPNTTSLPLSISYRCADKIVDFAHTIVQSIEKNTDGREGEVEFNSELSEIQDGDMVLCRNNAPLTKAYAELISMGKKCFIRGKDIGKNLNSLLKKVKCNNLGVDLTSDGVFGRLYLDLFESRNKIMKETKLLASEVMEMSIISSKYDMIKTLEVLAEGCKTTEELSKKIDSIFSDKTKEGIALSTIHKAKGLEANNVYIVMHSLMPNKSAVQKWEKDQEMNLMYVAYTRAKNKLSFVKEDDFKDLSVGHSESIKKIEDKICRLYNISEKFNEVTKNNFKNIIKNIKPIALPSNKKCITLNTNNRTTLNANKSTKNNIGLGGAIFDNKIIKVKK